MKTCDICGGKCGILHSFHCQDGVICKNCYRIVSNNYATTITGMTLTELKKRYIRNVQPLDLGSDGFETTRRIGSILLVDEKRHKFCILNNPRRSTSSTRPEIHHRDDVTGVHLHMTPALTGEELKQLMGDKTQSRTADNLWVEIGLGQSGTRQVQLITSPVRISTYAFRQSYKLACQIVEALRTL